MQQLRDDTYCFSNPFGNMENSLQLVMVQATHDLDLCNKTKAIRFTTNIITKVNKKVVVSVPYQQIKWK